MARRREKPYDGPDRRAPAQILIVNDDEGAATLLSRLLERQDYRVELATTHQQTLTEMTKLLPRAVVLDLTHGGIGSNLKLLEAIRHHDDERVAASRVVLIARQAANRVFSYQSGADGFLTRPFHADELLATLGQVLVTPFKDLPQHRRNQLESN